MSAFEFYLRTGWIVPDADLVEQKFNPWHGEDGRFTFAGGGGYGGAGAGGSWSPPQRPKPAKPVSTPRQTPKATLRSPNPATKEPDRVVRRNGYSYTIDAQNRTREVTGELQRGPAASRSRRSQMQAGATDRLSSDDGGHYIAARFNGPSDTFNHFAQDANFNRGAYRALEDKWANDMANGQHVSVEISPLYTGGSVRPYMILVRWTEAGKVRLNRFNNRRGGK